MYALILIRPLVLVAALYLIYSTCRIYYACYIPFDSLLYDMFIDKIAVDSLLCDIFADSIPFDSLLYDIIFVDEIAGLRTELEAESDKLEKTKVGLSDRLANTEKELQVTLQNEKTAHEEDIERLSREKVSLLLPQSISRVS